MLEKTPESPLASKIKPVNLKGNQAWILIRMTDAEVVAPVFWSSDANSRLPGKVPDAGKDRGQKEKRAAEDEMAGRHHRCNGHKRANFGRWWGIGKLGMLQSMGSPRVGLNWVTEQQQHEALYRDYLIFNFAPNLHKKKLTFQELHNYSVVVMGETKHIQMPTETRELWIWAQLPQRNGGLILSSLDNNEIKISKIWGNKFRQKSILYI